MTSIDRPLASESLVKLPKSINDTAALLGLGCRRALVLWDKHGPTAQADRILRLISEPPARRDKPGVAAILLVAGLGGVAIIGAARIAGVIPASNFLMTLAGTTSFTLLQPYFGGLHAQVPEAVAILSVLAPATLFTVNVNDLWKAGKLPEGFVKAVLHVLNVLKNIGAGISQAYSAMKPLKPLKAALLRLRFWRRRAV